MSLRTLLAAIAHLRYVLPVVCGIGVAGMASPSFAQPLTPDQQEYDYLFRNGHLVDSNGELALVLADGATIDLSEQRCLPPQTRGGIVQLNCSLLDGPVYYFDAATGAVVEVCSFWARGRVQNCPPPQWPMDVPDCDGRISAGILGTWRLAATPTVSGYVPYEGWRISITSDAIVFDIDDVPPIARRYSVIEEAGREYKLRFSDAAGATETLGVELMECGFIADAETVCGGFCQNFHDEVLSDGRLEFAVGKLAEQLGEEEANRFFEAARQQPIFPNRSYFHLDDSYTALPAR